MCQGKWAKVGLHTRSANQPWQFHQATSQPFFGFNNSWRRSSWYRFCSNSWAWRMFNYLLFHFRFSIATWRLDQWKECDNKEVLDVRVSRTVKSLRILCSATRTSRTADEASDGPSEKDDPPLNRIRKWTIRYSKVQCAILNGHFYHALKLSIFSFQNPARGESRIEAVPPRKGRRMRDNRMRWHARRQHHSLYDLTWHFPSFPTT